MLLNLEIPKTRLIFAVRDGAVGSSSGSRVLFLNNLWFLTINQSFERHTIKTPSILHVWNLIINWAAVKEILL
mgnify:CR=1 FL=1